MNLVYIILKKKPKHFKIKIKLLESQICNFEPLLNYRNNDVVEQSYFEAKLKLEEYYDHITQGIVLRSKTQWHEFGEKNNKYFLNVEKQNKQK